MIDVDISNIWGAVSLPELLGTEKALADAHLALDEETIRIPRAVEPILDAARQIREHSDVLVVLGCEAARGVIELLQGPERNLREKPQIFFMGNSFSTRQWMELTKLLEGKQVSLCTVSHSGDDLESAIALRSLSWMLERKYGTDEARKRIFAVSAGESCPLGRTAEAMGWGQFLLQSEMDILTAAGLLPMAVAGLNIEDFLEGVREAAESCALRSFENPLWLYAGVRQLMADKGKQIEGLTCQEPGFRRIGDWWQMLFETAGGLHPVAGAKSGNLLETVVHFDGPDAEVVIGEDIKNLDELNYLAGKPLSYVQAMAASAGAEAWADEDIPVVSIDCGELKEETIGQLLYFFQISAILSRKLTGGYRRVEKASRENLFRALGRPEPEVLPENSSEEFGK